MARQLAALGVDVIEAGFPIASEADAEAVQAGGHARARPDHRRAGPLHAGRHRPRRLGARAGRAPPHPRLHRHLGPAPRAQAAHVARRLSRRRGRRGPPRPALHRRRPVLGGGRDAQRSRLPLPRRRGGDLGRLHHGQPAGHGRLLDARRDRRVLPDDPRARVERPPRRLQHALPRRPRPGGRQHAGRGLRPARRRSSARSTASASAPATPRSKRS